MGKKGTPKTAGYGNTTAVARFSQLLPRSLPNEDHLSRLLPRGSGRH